MEIKNTNQVVSLPNGVTDSNKLGSSDKADVSSKAENLENHSAKNQDGYKVAVSARAQETKALHKKAFDIAKNTPPVRAERVAELKAQIQDGTYKIDSGKIADGMLREAIKEKLSTDLS
ncbi:MAG: flagellar biosynthesis anti-sigma factor FlgM [Bdellovibrionota bacterium]